MERPALVKIPDNYDSEHRYPLVVSLHSAVGYSELRSLQSQRCAQDALWKKSAKKGSFVLVAPLTNAGAEWWCRVGADHILQSVADVKRQYNIDENRVFCAGFSDGASGSFYMACRHTTPFAGFICLSGSLEAAQIDDDAVYLRSLMMKPLYIVNGGQDDIFPLDETMEDVDAMAQAGMTIYEQTQPCWSHGSVPPPPWAVFHLHEDARHRLWDYWGSERGPVVRFIQEISRDPFPPRIEWESDDSYSARCHWIQIDEISEEADSSPALALDLNPGSIFLREVQQGCPSPVRVAQCGHPYRERRPHRATPTPDRASHLPPASSLTPPSPV